MAVVLEWVETGRVFPLPLGRPVRIGRRRKGEIVLEDQHVSRRHCEAHWDGCRVRVQDLGSTNGTYLDADRRHGGARVRGPEGSLLRLGDVLHLGDVRLRLGTPSRVEDGWLAWQGGLVVSMAWHADESGDYGGLPVLADALEEAGCTDPDLLDHLRGPGPHVRGCWVVDLILGKGYAMTEQEWVICAGPGEWLICRAAEGRVSAGFLRDVVGNPFRPVTLAPGWLTPQVVALAQAANDQRGLPTGTLDVPRLAVLADALEDAGCTDADLLNHLRGPGPHYRGCWVVDLILGNRP
jgi:hypothetical protein